MLKLETLHQTLSNAVADKAIPGAVLYVGRGEEELLFEAYGEAQWVPQPIPMTKETVFDLASLTKVCATLPCLLTLLGENWIDMESPLSTLLPEPYDEELGMRTVYELLTHTAGLVPSVDLRGRGETRQETMQWLQMQPPAHMPGEDVVYSDIGFLLLGEAMMQWAGASLKDVAQRRIYGPLGMAKTGFCPDPALPFAATEVVNGVTTRGVVHDENAAVLGGVAGHAGLFSTAGDLARYCKAWLDFQLLDPVWIQRSTLNYTPGLSENRGLGWKVYREGEEGNLFGHTGFTGTALWMDEGTRTYAILLTNRVHPLRENRAIEGLRKAALADLFDLA